MLTSSIRLNVNFNEKSKESFDRVYVGYINHRLFPIYHFKYFNWRSIWELQNFCSKKNYTYTNQDRYNLSTQELTCSDKNGFPHYFHISNMCNGTDKSKKYYISYSLDNQIFECYYAEIN